MFPPASSSARPERVRPQPESNRFFEALFAAGLRHYVLYPEKTGPNNNAGNGSDSEFFGVFYKGERIQYAPKLPKGFVARPLVKNPDFQRVPFAFPFRVKGGFDFVLISVHSALGSRLVHGRAAEKEARGHEPLDRRVGRPK